MAGDLLLCLLLVVFSLLLVTVQATLPAESRQPGEVIPVRLRAAVTEVGTLRLEAVPRDGSEHWKVEFNVRSAAGE